MNGDSSPTFGALLRRHRDDAGLTQEELAERAGLTPEAIGLLERGERRRPQAYTVRKLGDGLGLTAGDRARFEAAARLGRAQPAPPSSPTPRRTLPEQPTPLIGREREVAAVATLLGEGRARLLTLTGPGGVGKTRLALQVATELATVYPHGVWLVELAALAEPALVAQTVAATLGVREEAERPLVDTLIDDIGDRRLLLVLDNCEHLVAVCAALAAALLRACPGARLLATSREGLMVAGETTYRVPSLAVPDPRRPSPPGDLLRYAAVRLFVDRARLRRPAFALALGNAGAVSRICARLDGIPLALELAAARIGALPVGDIADRLDDCVRVLAGGPRTALPRQQTLRASLDWSYGLLAEPERTLLRRLSVFAGGWTLEAAEAACAGEGIEEEDVLTLLAHLVDKSLVHLENGDGDENGDARYRLLEVVRQYGQGKLRAADEEDAARDRHAAWCVALARQAEPKLTGPEQAAWLERLEAENDNLRAALRWDLREGGGEGGSAAGVQLAGLLWRFWDMRGLLTEGRGWLQAALARDAAPAAIRGPALTGAANLAWTQGDYQQAMDLSAQSVAMQRELGRTPALADALNSLGNVMRKVGEYARARALFEESLTVQREMGRTRGAAIAIGNLGLVALDQGDDERATGLLRESLALHRALGDRRIVAILLTNLGQLANWRGDHAQAVTLHQEGLALRRDIGDTRTIPISLSSLGGVAEARGDYRGARSLYEESLVLFLAMDDQEGIATCLEGMARSIAARALDAGDPPSPDDPSSPDNPPSPDEWERRDAMGALRQAARLFGAAAAVRERSAAPLPPRERAQHDRHAVSVRAALGDDVFGAAQADGRAMPREQVIAAVLERTLE